MVHLKLIKSILIDRAWLFDNIGIVKRATRRVGLLTGLVTTSSTNSSNAEPFQIVNYGIGGMYNPHFDTLNSVICIYHPIFLNKHSFC